MTDAIDDRIGAGAEAVLIAGPTASGKSRLALALAERHGGVVINADSMQVYAELRIITARPDVAEEQRLPHRLYGHVPAATRYSAGQWLSEVEVALTKVRGAGRLPILVGGTGLYFKALTEGLAATPPIPDDVRARVRDETEGLTGSELHARLAEADPLDAAGIRPSDQARILRALEVYEATGRPLIRWREAEHLPALVDVAKTVCVVLDPERGALHERISERAEEMVRAGALAEAEALGRLGLDPDLPAMKAIGVRELLGHLRGDISLAETVAAIKTETRRYAKRQVTWFRHQMADWERIDLLP